MVATLPCNIQICVISRCVIKELHCITNFLCYNSVQGCNVEHSSAHPEGGKGGPDPPGKSQVIWVSIGNKQLDPLWKMLDPPGTLKNGDFL